MRFFFLLWSVRVFAAFNLTWGMPSLSLDSNPPIGDTDSNGCIVMDLDGNALATWSRTTGNRASENIWAASYNHSLRIWTGAMKISGSGSASNSQAAVDKEGNVMIVWEEGFPTRIHYRHLTKEGVWTPDLSMAPAVIQPSQNAQTSPQIAIDGGKNALVIWTEFFGGIHHVFSAKKPFERPWTQAKEISTGLQDALLIPSRALVVNDTGDGIAVWQEGGTEIHAARYVEGAFLPAMLIGSEGAHSPSVGIDSAGDSVIVWAQNHAIFSKTIQQGILSSTQVCLSHPDYLAERPHIGLDATGDAVVVFERYNSIHKFIAGATLPKGAFFWTKQIDLSAPSPMTAEAAGYPVFKMNAIGDGVAIWKEWTGTNMVVQGAGFSLGTWSSIRTLSSPMGDAGSPTPAYDLSLALNPSGNILAIWPEDPLKRGAQQIKATAGVGLANRGPMPPVVLPASVMQGIVTGRQVLHKFPAHSDLINLLTWEAPDNVDHFNVYRGNLSSLIAMTNTPEYEDHQRIPKRQEIYLITSVDPYGQESSPITILVDPL